MKAEIEVKFLDASHDDMRAKLTELGAVCEQPMRLMRRYTFDNPFMKNGKDAFVRVRDEGHRVTMTYKQFDELSVDGVKEIEIEVSDFDMAAELLLQSGVGEDMHSYQETRRETWRLGEVEIVLDEWPWLKPYIEIEAESEVALREMAKSLGLDWASAVFGDVMAAYRAEYSHLTLKDTIGSVNKVKFGDPLPELFKSIEQ